METQNRWVAARGVGRGWAKGIKKHTLPVTRSIRSGDGMYSTVTTVSDTVLHT